MEPSKYVEKPAEFKFANLKERIIAGLIPKENEKFIGRPFDLYCPSMQEKLARCLCEICGMYWPCVAAKNRHKKCHKNGPVDEMNTNPESYLEVQDEFCQMQESEEKEGEYIPIIKDLITHLVSPFECLD